MVILNHCVLFQVLTNWNKGELSSFLIEITRDITKFKDTDGSHLLDKIKDSAGQVNHEKTEKKFFSVGLQRDTNSSV